MSITITNPISIPKSLNQINNDLSSSTSSLASHLSESSNYSRSFERENKMLIEESKCMSMKLKNIINRASLMDEEAELLSKDLEGLSKEFTSMRKKKKLLYAKMQNMMDSDIISKQSEKVSTSIMSFSPEVKTDITIPGRNSFAVNFLEKQIKVYNVQGEFELVNITANMSISNIVKKLKVLVINEIETIVIGFDNNAPKASIRYSSQNMKNITSEIFKDIVKILFL